ncbi:MAG: DUF2934 domain-containing protein [Undibacterium sp.]|nr:DUF2934 domain-containing protein [Opitutaceae bacterium]
MKAANRKEIPVSKPTLNSPTALDGTAPESPEAMREKIAREAYHRWEKAGRPHGGDHQHWFEAEKNLHRQGNPAYPTLEEREAIVKSASN